MIYACMVLVATFYLQPCLGQVSMSNRLAAIRRFSGASAREGQIRLTGGRRADEGNVEIFHLGRWGSICDDEWDENEAKIVCRTLGFWDSPSIATGNSRFGEAGSEYSTTGSRN